MNLTPQDWPLVESLLDRLEDVPVTDRTAALEALCSDRPDLVQTVESLLRAQDACDEVDFLEEPAHVPDDVLDDSDAPPPERLGAFKVGERIGSGGYGVVYLAERDDVGQRVALKVLRGAAGGKSYGRFRREQRILALLDHPAIPRLIDSGLAETGEIYFAMELVDGEAITDYVRRHNCGLRERLELFLQACDAVRYAHSRLVVHRDIKPHNVMVAGAPGRPVVKVVDFGIAAPLGPDAERITATGPPAPMTIAFAAPEQLRGERAVPATDVYGLGLLLYVLLTDGLPYRVHRRSYAEMERTVLDAVIQNPSAASPHPWARRLRGDLDHVVQKALSKDAGRRYATADALHADIRAYLDGLPVSARRPSRVYAAWRALYRRRGTAAACGAVVLAVGATYTYGVSRERSSLIEAAQERAVVAEVLGDILGALDGPVGSVPETEVILRRALYAIRTRITTHPVHEAELLTLVAERYETLGRHGNAIPLYDRAVALEAAHRTGHPAHTEALAGLGRALVVRRMESTTRDYVRADSVLRLALDQASQTFGPGSPQAATILSYLGAGAYYRGDYTLAARYCLRAQELLERSRRDSARWAANETRVMRSEGSWLGYGFRHHSYNSIEGRLAFTKLYLAYAHNALGRPEESIPLLETVAQFQLREYPHAFVTGSALDALASAYFDADFYALSDSTYRRAADVMRVVTGDVSADVARAIGLSVAPKLFRGEVDEAIRSAREAYSIAEATGDSLAIMMQLYNLGYVLRYTHRWREALPALRAVLVMLDRTRSEHPAVRTLRAGAMAEHSAALLLGGDQPGAERDAKRALRLALMTPNAAVIGHARVTLAEALVARGEYTEAISTVENVYHRFASGRVPGNPRLQAARVALVLANAHDGIGAPERAEFFRRESRRLGPRERVR